MFINNWKYLLTVEVEFVGPIQDKKYELNYPNPVNWTFTYVWFEFIPYKSFLDSSFWSEETFN